MAKIGADIGLMRETARRMRAAAEQFDQHGGSARAAVEPLGAAWSGAVRDAAMERWGAITPIFGGSAEALRAYADSLDKIADALEREAHRGIFSKVFGGIADVLGITAGIFSFAFPPLGIALGLGSFGTRLTAELPDLVAYGDWKAFTGRMVNAAPLPPGIAKQIITTGTNIALHAHSVKDALHMVGDAIPGSASGAGYLGTVIKVANSKDVVDGMLNTTALFGPNDALATVVTVAQLARANNADELLRVVGERLSPGAQVALRIIRDAAGAANPTEALQRVLTGMPPGALQEIAPVLQGVVPPELASVEQTVAGLDPLGKARAVGQISHAAQTGDLMGMVSAGAGLVPNNALPPAVQSAAGFVYATRDSLLAEAGRHWTSPGPISLGPAQVSLGGGGVQVEIGGGPVPLDLRAGPGGVHVSAGQLPSELRDLAGLAGSVPHIRPATIPAALRDFFG